MTESTVKSKGWAEAFEAIADHVPILRGYRAKEGMREITELVKIRMTNLNSVGKAE